jgi:hypothetical protein
MYFLIFFLYCSFKKTKGLKEIDFSKKKQSGLFFAKKKKTLFSTIELKRTFLFNKMFQIFSEKKTLFFSEILSSKTQNIV